MKIDEKNDPTNREKFKMVNSSGKKTPSSRFWPSPTAGFPVKADPPRAGVPATRLFKNSASIELNTIIAIFFSCVRSFLIPFGVCEAG